MVPLQTFLEYVCHTFMQRHAPETLLSHGWDCPEAASLRAWSEEIYRLRGEESEDNMSNVAAVKDLTQLMASVQDTTVNRTPIDVAKIQEYLQGAEAFVKLLGLEDCLGVISQLRLSVCMALDESSRNNCVAQQRLEKRLREIEVARARLDQQVKVAEAELQEAEDHNRSLAATNILEATERVQAILRRIDSGLGDWGIS